MQQNYLKEACTHHHMKEPHPPQDKIHDTTSTFIVNNTFSHMAEVIGLLSYFIWFGLERYIWLGTKKILLYLSMLQEEASATNFHVSFLANMATSCASYLHYKNSRVP